MKKRLTLILVGLFAFIGMALAQTTASGVVVSSTDGEPVIGAAVRVKDTNTGTVTDVSGKFTVQVPSKNSLLEISYIGMVTKTVKAGKDLHIVLEGDENVVDEVMVIAYGTQKKSAFTGSAAVVGSNEIGKVQVTNAVDALKGKAAGVQIYNATGQPGSVSTIRIRGVNSILAGNDPLIVVDGSPYDGSMNDINPTDIESMTVLKDAASTALYGARGGNGVILITTKSGPKGKDAQISFDAKWGVNSRGSQEYDKITSPAGYYETWYKGLYNYATQTKGYSDNQAWQWANNNLIDTTQGWGLGYNVYSVPEGQYMIGTNGKLNPNATLGNYVTGADGSTYYLTPDNWMDETYHNSMRQEYTVSATGSTDKSTFYASANYLSQDGIVTGSDYERFTGRLKADYQLKSWAKLSGNMTYSHFTRNYLSNEGSSNTGNVFALSNMAPIYPVYIRDANGNIVYDKNARINAYDYGDGSYLGFSRPYLSQSNPLSDLQLDTQENEGNTFNGTGQLDLYLPFGFTFTSINNAYLHENRYTGVTNPYFGQYASSNGIVSKEHDRTWSYNYQQRLNWHKVFGIHDIEVMVGHEYYRSRDYELDYYKTNMFSQQNKELAGAVVAGTGSSELDDYNTESWISRVMYNVAEKYFVSGSFMRQGSSRFSTEKRWGSFWSVGGGWLINKEKFMEDVKWVDELKLKASYGENGNDNIGDYLYTNRYSIVNSNDAVSLVPSTTKENPDITWEKNAKFNVGIDFSLWNGRLTGSVEYYNNITKDMISSFPYAPSYGYTSSYANVGNMKNDGVEVDLHADILRLNHFTWSVNANITTNHNEITKLPEERKVTEVEGHFGYSSGNYYFTEGYSRYTYYTKKYAGVYNENTYAQTGDETYDASKAGLALYWKRDYQKDADGNVVKDANGVKVVEGESLTTSYSDADYYIIGDVLPDVYGGFGTSFEFYGFDASVDFQYQLGGKVYDSEYNSLMALDRGYGMHVDMLKAYSSENPTSNIPRLNANDSYMASTSDRFLTNASYLTLANITLGYTVPKSFCKKVGLQKVRIYAVGDNLYTWSKRKGLDPRQSITGGSSGIYYSTIRTISGGITLTF